MCNTLIAVVTIVLALCMAILVSVLPVTNMHFVIFVSRFFEVMIPILAVGALIKYLCSCPSKKECK